jgi:hypothetical protein
MTFRIVTNMSKFALKGILEMKGRSIQVVEEAINCLDSIGIGD